MIDDYYPRRIMTGTVMTLHTDKTRQDKAAIKSCTSRTRVLKAADQRNYLLIIAAMAK